MKFLWSTVAQTKGLWFCRVVVMIILFFSYFIVCQVHVTGGKHVNAKLSLHITLKVKHTLINVICDVLILFCLFLQINIKLFEAQKYILSVPANFQMNKKTGNVETIGNEDVFQAVIIADNFNKNLAPMTDSLPLGLLPLVNVPLLDYVLETLSRSGVQEVFLFASTHIDQIRLFLQKATESGASWSSLTIQIVVSERCRSFGDAMRDLDAKGLLRGHFVLMGANTITNIPLLPIMEYHKKTYKKDKGAAMTVVLTKTGVGQTCSENVIIAVDQSNNRILFHHRESSELQKKINLPLEVFLLHPEVSMHYDVQDPGIAICSPLCLPLFADNFDFQTRDDFIRGLLMNEEILASSVYCYPLEHQSYAAKINNWSMYQLVSHDVINRWVYPLVPNMGISQNQQAYVMLRNNVYKNKTVILAKGGILQEDVVIAEGCSVSEHSIISNSVIGRNCFIGSNVHITGSYLFDGAVVHDNSSIHNCVLGSGVTIKKNAKVKHCVFGNDVVILEQLTVCGSVIQSKAEIDQSCEVLGPAAFCLDMRESDDSDDEIDRTPEPKHHIGADSIGPLKTLCASSHLGIYNSSSEEELSEAGSPPPEDSSVFLSEVIDSLARGFEEKLNCDYLILEINSSRYAYNMALREVNYYVMRALLGLPQLQIAKDKLALLKDLFKYFRPVIDNYIKGADAMLDCLRAIGDTCLGETSLCDRAAQIVHHLYDMDVVSEECIIEWHSELLESNSDRLKDSIQKLVHWLQQASEESSDEDDASD